jgi:hypothetical protein
MSDLTGKIFKSEASAEYGARWWNMNFSDAATRAKPHLHPEVPAWTVIIEIYYQEDDTWIIAEYLPAKRELWS